MQPEIDGLVQERRNSSALAMAFFFSLAMELRLTCTNPPKCCLISTDCVKMWPQENQNIVMFSQDNEAC